MGYCELNHCGAQPLTQPAGVGKGRAWKKNRHLLTAIPVHDITGPARSLQGIGDLSECVIRGLVQVSLVVEMEEVNVAEHQCVRFAPLCRLRVVRSQVFFECCSIEQPGPPVVPRLVREAHHIRLERSHLVIDDREYERSRTRKDFIKQYIFPGGCLPSITAIAQAATRASDLHIVGLEDIGRHYARTLSDWRNRLDDRWLDARALGFDDRFLRMWRFYFAYCEAGFLERRVSDVQMVLARAGWRDSLRALRV